MLFRLRRQCSGASGGFETGASQTEAAGATEPTFAFTREEKEQEIAMPYYPDRSMNPYQSTDITNRTLFPLVYQGLFAVDRNYEVEAVLCGRYTVTEDFRRYVFYPAAATFSDGSPLTAEDIYSSLQAAAGSAYYSGRFRHVDVISLSGDGGVTVELDTPYENLPLLLDVPVVKGNQTGDPRPLGTGAYVYAQAPGSLSLRRRTDWWTSGAFVVRDDTIELVEARSNAQIRDEFQFGEVGVVRTDPCTDTYAEYRSDYELWDCENGIFLFLACNRSSKVFAVNSVRSALTYAIDRKALADDVYRGFGRSATLPVSPKSPWYNEGLAQSYSFDPDRFSKAVGDAKFKGSEVKLLVNSNDTMRVRAARAIGKMLEASGLKVTLAELPGEEYRDAYLAGNYDLLLGQTRLSPNMDLSTFFDDDGELSYNGMADAATYAMCMEALENSGNYETLCQIVMEDGMLCPVLFGAYAVYARRGLISELTPSRDNVFFTAGGSAPEEIRTIQADAETP